MAQATHRGCIHSGHLLEAMALLVAATQTAGTIRWEHENYFETPGGLAALAEVRDMLTPKPAPDQVAKSGARPQNEFEDRFNEDGLEFVTITPPSTPKAKDDAQR